MPGPIAFDPEITIAMHVSNLDRSIDWYTNVLGFAMLYKVDEIAWAEFESHDVRFDGDTITIEGLVKLATFFDPDGNPLMLSQSLMQQ